MTPETTNSSLRPSGVYRNPVTKQEMIATGSEKLGNPQADAYVRQGFEYVGPADPKKYGEPPVDPHAAPAYTGPETNEARLQRELDEANARVSELEAAKAKKPSAKAAKAPAAEEGAK